MENLDLQEIRGQLDEIDTRLVELFEKRMELCGQVAEFKIGTGKAVYDGQREKQKLAAVAAMGHSEFNRKGVHELFSQIMTISRRLQYRLLAEHGKGGDTGFTMVDELKREGARIVYQGVEGAYSHRAALQYFGEDADVYHVPVFEDAMIEVEEGRADYGVLPIENSLAGAVIDNYDNLLKHQAEWHLPDKRDQQQRRRRHLAPKGRIHCKRHLHAFSKDRGNYDRRGKYDNQSHSGFPYDV